MPNRRTLVAAALSLVAFVLVGCGAPLDSSRPAGAGATPTPVPTSAGVGFDDATVDGLTIRTVSALLAAREAGTAPGGPYALKGYWTDRSVGHSCAPPDSPPGDLEIYCGSGEYGIAERDEAVMEFNFETSIETPASGPILQPWVGSKVDQERLFGVNNPVRDQVHVKAGTPFWPPVPIIVVGHFDDPAAADCRAQAKQLCADRFVIDRIVLFDPQAVPGPTATPVPTAFPYDNPPSPMFSTKDCYGGVPMSFAGWTTTDKLDLPYERLGYVYAMVTRDVIPVGDWFDNPNYPGHKTRQWGRGVCLAEQFQEGVMEFAIVNGTGFIEFDDGRHIPDPTP